MTTFITRPKNTTPLTNNTHAKGGENTEKGPNNALPSTRIPSIKQQITYAHGWIGIIASSILCLIFWFGGLSLFRAEIQAWSEAPDFMAMSRKETEHSAVSPVSEPPLTLVDVIDEVIPLYDFDQNEHLSIVLPQPSQPYYQFYIDLIAKDQSAHPTAEVNVHPNTGNVLGDVDQYPVANFFYRLHYSGNMGTAGLYTIGFFALLLGFALFSGVWIQAKKLWQQFFLYRNNKKATGYLDAHRVIGVISLPYAAMFALTGLVFNLVIVYQATFALILYKGDSKALLADAGYATHLAMEISGIKSSMEPIPSLIEQTNQEKGPVYFARIHAYGDQNAMLELKGEHRDAHLGGRYDIYYRISTGEVLFDGGSEANHLRAGLNVLEDLHFGNFGGLGLKIIYFLLALAMVSTTILGNLLWVEKRKKKVVDHSKALWLIPKITIGTCLGLIGSTFVCLFYVRVMPFSSVATGDILPLIFVVSLLVWLVLGFVVDQSKSLIKHSLLLTAALSILTVLLGCLQYPSDWMLLSYSSSKAILTVDVGLLLLSAIFVMAVFKTKT